MSTNEAQRVVSYLASCDGEASPAVHALAVALVNLIDEVMQLRGQVADLRKEIPDNPEYPEQPARRESIATC